MSQSVELPNGTQAQFTVFNFEKGKKGEWRANIEFDTNNRHWQQNADSDFDNIEAAKAWCSDQLTKKWKSR